VEGFHSFRQSREGLALMGLQTMLNLLNSKAFFGCSSQ
jgi:hypothetical protein